MAFCDIISILLIAPELFYVNYRKWTGSQIFCSIYLATQSIVNTASSYLIIAIGLHAISTYNLILRLKRNAKHRCTGQKDESEDCYQTSINNQQRSLIIDYSKKKTKVAVLLPALFTWFLAVSVSVPLFIFSQLDSDRHCNVYNVDPNNKLLMAVFLNSIQIILPAFCMVMILLSVSCKMAHSKDILLKCGKSQENVSLILKFAMSIILAHIIFEGHRLCGSILLDANNTTFSVKSFLKIRSDYKNIKSGIIFGMISNVVYIVRPIIYLALFTNPSTRKNASKINPVSL